jgi:hypothetical protein
MYKLQYMNITIETDSEARKNELISIGYELVDELENSNMSTADITNETSENEISQDADISKEQSEDNADETDEENKAGKKSGKANKK